MKLITEQKFNDINVGYELNENTGKKRLHIEGIFMQGDIKNQNGRVYPLQMLIREVNNFSANLVSKKRAVGELNHPTSPAINLDRVSHLITELKVSGKNVMGKAMITDTPMGKIAAGLLNDGVQLGVSSRGMGTVKQNESGVDEVQDDFRLATIDIVADPSAPEAFVNGIMENKEWIWDNGIWSEQSISKAKEHINNTAMKQLQETKLRLFEEFLKNL